MTRALIIAAPRSGAGKTTVTLALSQAFINKGLRVRAAKNGPDYIDPQFHEAITGAPCCNLDSWAMTAPSMFSMMRDMSEGVDLLLIEASMGLFDGLDAPFGLRGSVADLAAMFDIPVMLVMDVTGQGQSAAMIAAGYGAWRPDVKLAGVWFNRVASDRHLALCKADLQTSLLGASKRTSSLVMPQRHLGLIQPNEYEAWRDGVQALASDIAQTCDLDAVLRASAPLGGISERFDADCATETRFFPLPPGQRIAIARDAAFSFIYPHLLSSWRKNGAEICFFSPLQDEAPPSDCDVCWLPGGYPELYAGRLSHCTRFRTEMHHFAETRLVHGECGGYMVLGDALTDGKGETHKMLGLLSHATSFAQKKMTLGYRKARLLEGGAIGPAHGTCFGHEFHYATIVAPGVDRPLATLQDGVGKSLGHAGGLRGHVSGSFFHVMSVGCLADAACDARAVNA